MAQLYTDTETLGSLQETFELLAYELKKSKAELGETVDIMAHFWQDEAYDRFRTRAQDHLQQLAEASRIMLNMVETFERQKRAAEHYLDD